MLRFLENSRWFSAAVLLGTLVLLTLAVFDLGGDLQHRAELKRRANPPDAILLVGKIEALFSPATLVAMRPATNGVNAFYTTHFQPPPAPPKPPDPTPPPPAPKKIQLTYQGVYQTAGGKKKAFVKVGDGLFVGPVGAKVAADLVVAEITVRTLILKNASSQTNILEFNVKKDVEVPSP